MRSTTTEGRLSLREAADALGISEVTARRWVKSGKLKAYQPGRKYLIPASAVEELLKASGGPAAEPTLEAWLEERVGHAHLSGSQEEVCRLVSGPHGEEILARMREELRTVAEERKKYPAMDPVRIAGTTYTEVSRKYIAAVFAADLSGLVAQDYLSVLAS